MQNTSNTKSTPMFALFVLAATSLLNAVVAVPKKLKDKHAKIQALFDKEAEPFGCYTTKAAELIGYLTGYTPVIRPKQNASFPAMSVRKFTTGGFIVIMGTMGYGFSPNNANGYCQATNLNSVETTREEAISFLESLGTNTAFSEFSEDTVTWAYSKLGGDHGKFLMAAIQASGVGFSVTQVK